MGCCRDTHIEKLHNVCGLVGGGGSLLHVQVRQSSKSTSAHNVLLFVPGPFTFMNVGGRSKQPEGNEHMAQTDHGWQKR